MERYVDAFSHHSRRASEPAWLGSLCAQAIDSFSTLGFPTVKDEDWKYTNAAPIAASEFQVVAPGEVEASRFRDPAGGAYLAGDLFEALVFIDGHFVPELSRHPTGGDLVVRSLAEVLDESPELVEPYLGRQIDLKRLAFPALNTAFIQDGVFIYLPEGACLDAPLELIFCSTDHGHPTISHPRNLIVAKEASRGTIIERYVGQGDYLTNAVTEIFLGPGAELGHCKVQREGERAFHLSRIEVEQAAGSRFTSHSIAIGAGLSRTEIHTVLAGEGAEASLYGLYALAGQRHADHHTTVDHATARTHSRQIYKGILDDRSHGVFTGRVIVREGAVGTEAAQTNRNLLLSDSAVVDTRPQLEIYNDDVRCTHGAAIGQLDEDALFYLKSRGIESTEARRILTRAFASEILETLGDLPVRRELEVAVGGWLAEASVQEAGA